MARVCVLGPVEVLDDGGAPLPMAPRTRRLLAALTLRPGEVVTVDRLAYAVWGEQAPEHPGNAVQTLVSRLRSALRTAGGGPQVLTRPEGYVLVTGSSGLDSVAFRGLLARARAAHGSDEQITMLGAALALWRGAAYGLLAEEDPAREEAIALTAQRATAVADLAEAELAAGQAGVAQERVTSLIAERPYDERPTLLLMRCLHATGRTADALAAYADLRRRLRDDLGLWPSADAVAAQRELLRPSPGPPVLGLPLPGDVLGRSADERALTLLLADARLVVVLGPGGLGKTTLAYRVARQVADGYADGVVVTELGRLEPGDDVAAAVCTVLQLPTGRTGPRRQLLQRWRDQQLLLVLDSCEHLLGDVAELLDRLLAECPGVTVLATSRAPLRLSAEHVLRLQPLLPAVAAELFRRRARLRLPDFDPDEEVTAAAVAELCRRLDGLPLAIELAAGRVDVITPVELVQRWSWHRSVLRGGPAGDPRHRSLTALVDWSYDRLPAGVQHVFDAVCVFAGEFSLGDAAELLGLLGAYDDPGWALTELVDTSMITRSAATGRLRVLETLRSYGRLQLAARGRTDEVAAAHAGLFADRGVAGRDELYGPGQPREAARLLDSVDELRAAFGWALEHRPEVAARIVGSAVLLVEHAMLGEPVGWADAVLARSDAPPNPWVAAVAAAGARFAGDLDRAADLAETAAALSGADVRCRAYAWTVRADVALFVGDRAEVLACRDRAAALVADNCEVAGTAQMIEGAALLARRYAGEAVPPAEAVRLRVDAERHGRSVVAAWGSYLQGELLLVDDPSRAAEVLSSALERARDLGDAYLTGVALVSAASAAQRSGRVEQARRLLVEVIRHWQVRGDLTHQWTTLRNVVPVLVASNQPTEALLLAAALLVPERAAAGFGNDARLLTATADRLVNSLDESAAGLVSRAQALGDDRVIEAALLALTSQTVPDSPRPPAQDNR